MTTISTAFSNSTSPRKALHISLWTVQVLLGVFFAFVGSIKIITPYAELATQMAWVNDVPMFVPKLAGISEIAGAIGLILPAALRIKPLLTPLAAVGLVFVMLPATILHVSRGGFEIVTTTLILAGLAGFVAWGRIKGSPIAPK